MERSQKYKILTMLALMLVVLLPFSASASMSVLKGKWQGSNDYGTLTLYIGDGNECLYILSNLDKSIDKKYGSIHLEGNQLTFHGNDYSTKTFYYIFNGKELKLLEEETEYAFLLLSSEWIIPEALIGDWLIKSGENSDTFSFRDDGSWYRNLYRTGIYIVDHATITIISDDGHASIALYDISDDTLTISQRGGISQLIRKK